MDANECRLEDIERYLHIVTKISNLLTVPLTVPFYTIRVPVACVCQVDIVEYFPIIYYVIVGVVL